MTADPVSRFFELQIRHIHFVAQIPHLEELKQNDTSFNRTGVMAGIKDRLPSGEASARKPSASQPSVSPRPLLLTVPAGCER